jgi:hypothetical protein
MSTPSNADQTVGTASPSGAPSSPGPSVTVRPGWQRWVALGLVLAAVVVVLAAAFASPDPDGLERVAEDHGFIERAEDALFQVIPDYVLPGISDPLLATVGAGLIGLLVVFGLVVGLGLLLGRRAA